MSSEFKDYLDSDENSLEQDTEYNICMVCDVQYFYKPKYGLVCPSGCAEIHEDIGMNGFAFH